MRVTAYGFLGDGVAAVLKPKLITCFRAAGRKKKKFGGLVDASAVEYSATRTSRINCIYIAIIMFSFAPPATTTECIQGITLSCFFNSKPTGYLKCHWTSNVCIKSSLTSFLKSSKSFNSDLPIVYLLVKCKEHIIFEKPAACMLVVNQ